MHLPVQVRRDGQVREAEVAITAGRRKKLRLIEVKAPGPAAFIVLPMHYPASELVIDPVLIRKYDVSGPRYTSYPTADRFVEAFGETDYLQALTQRMILVYKRPDRLYFVWPDARFCKCLYLGNDPKADRVEPPNPSRCPAELYELCRQAIREDKPLIDLLAAVPSVVYGLWGIAYLGPKLGPVYEWLEDNLGFLPFFAGPASTTGRTILTAGIVLAIMALPIITAITREIFTQTPTLQQEAALALGATRWEMTKMAVFPYARSGMVSAAMLALGRALGETMAVTFVLGNAHFLTASLLEPGNSIAATIANEFTEADSPLYLSSLIALGFLLFVVTFVVLSIAKVMLMGLKRREGK